MVPAAKRARLTTWQAYMKNFGQTNGRFLYIVALYYNLLATVDREIFVKIFPYLVCYTKI